MRKLSTQCTTLTIIGYFLLLVYIMSLIYLAQNNNNHHSYPHQYRHHKQQTKMNMIRSSEFLEHRSTKKNDDQHVCSVFMYTDPFLWRKVYKLEQGSRKSTFRRIKRMLQNSIEYANAVFSNVEFITIDKRHGIHRGIRFQMTDYLIDTDETCNLNPRYGGNHFEDCEEHSEVPIDELCKIKPMCKNKSNLFCNQINTMRFYLHAFSSNGSILKYKLEEFCLSFAFTYRKIDDFQGMAWIKGHDLQNPMTKSTHGYCASPDASCYNETLIPSDDPNHFLSSSKNEYNYHRNTGVVNCRVNSVPKNKKRFSPISSTPISEGVLSESVASQVFAHEVGHSFGARHDDIDKSCNPLGKDNYLMTGKAKKILLGQTTTELSECSIQQIGKHLSFLSPSECMNHKQNEETGEKWTGDKLATIVFSCIMLTMIVGIIVVVIRFCRHLRHKRTIWSTKI